VQCGNTAGAVFRFAFPILQFVHSYYGIRRWINY
jgi:hypothetical protein